MPHPSPRWRVAVQLARVPSGVFFAQQYELDAQRADTAMARSIRAALKTNSRRVTRRTEVRLRAWCVGKRRKS